MPTKGIKKTIQAIDVDLSTWQNLRVKNARQLWLIYLLTTQKDLIGQLVWLCYLKPSD